MVSGSLFSGVSLGGGDGRLVLGEKTVMEGVFLFSGSLFFAKGREGWFWMVICSEREGFSWLQGEEDLPG